MKDNDIMLNNLGDAKIIEQQFAQEIEIVSMLYDWIKTRSDVNSNVKDKLSSAIGSLEEHKKGIMKGVSTILTQAYGYSEQLIKNDIKNAVNTYQQDCYEINEIVSHIKDNYTLPSDLLQKIEVIHNDKFQNNINANSALIQQSTSNILQTYNEHHQQLADIKNGYLTVYQKQLEADNMLQSAGIYTKNIMSTVSASQQHYSDNILKIIDKAKLIDTNVSHDETTVQNLIDDLNERIKFYRDNKYINYHINITEATRLSNDIATIFNKILSNTLTTENLQQFSDSDLTNMVQSMNIIAKDAPYMQLSEDALNKLNQTLLVAKNNIFSANTQKLINKLNSNTITDGVKFQQASIIMGLAKSIKTYDNTNIDLEYDVKTQYSSSTMKAYDISQVSNKVYSHMHDGKSVGTVIAEATKEDEMMYNTPMGRNTEQAVLSLIQNDRHKNANLMSAVYAFPIKKFTLGGVASVEQKKVLTNLSKQLARNISNTKKELLILKQFGTEKNEKLIKELENDLQEMSALQEDIDSVKQTNVVNTMKEFVSGGFSDAMSLISKGAKAFGFGSVLNLASFADEVKSFDVKNGDLLYENYMLNSSMGVDVSTHSADRVLGQGAEYLALSKGKIDISAPTQLYSALVKNVGGAYGASPQSGAEDLQLMTEQLTLATQVYDINPSVITDSIDAWYKQNKLDAATAIRMTNQMMADAKTFNVPINKYIQTVTQLNKTLRHNGMDGTSAVGMIKYLMNDGMRLEDASAMYGTVIGMQVNFRDNFSKSAFWGGLTGNYSNLFDAGMDAVLTTDMNGDVIGNPYQKTGAAMMKQLQSNITLYGGDTNKDIRDYAIADTIQKMGGTPYKLISRIIHDYDTGNEEDLGAIMMGDIGSELQENTKLTESLNSQKEKIAKATEYLTPMQRYHGDRAAIANKTAIYLRNNCKPLFDKIHEGAHEAINFVTSGIEKAIEIFKEITDNKLIQRAMQFGAIHPFMFLGGAMLGYGAIKAGGKLGGKLLWNGAKSAFNHLTNHSKMSKLEETVAEEASKVKGNRPFETIQKASGKLKKSLLSSKKGKMLAAIVGGAGLLAGGIASDAFAHPKNLSECEIDEEEQAMIDRGGTLEDIITALTGGKGKAIFLDKNKQPIRDESSDPPPPQFDNLKEVNAVPSESETENDLSENGFTHRNKDFDVDAYIKAHPDVNFDLGKRSDFAQVMGNGKMQAGLATGISQIANVITGGKHSALISFGSAFATSAISNFSDDTMSLDRKIGNTLLDTAIYGGANYVGVKASNALGGGITGGLVGSAIGGLLGYGLSESDPSEQIKSAMGLSLDSEGIEQQKVLDEMYLDSTKYNKNLYEILNGKDAQAKVMKKLLKNNGIDYDNLTGEKKETFDTMIKSFSFARDTLAQVLVNCKLTIDQLNTHNNKNTVKRDGKEVVLTEEEEKKIDEEVEQDFKSDDESIDYNLNTVREEAQEWYNEGTDWTGNELSQETKNKLSAIVNYCNALQGDESALDEEANEILAKQNAMIFANSIALENEKKQIRSKWSDYLYDCIDELKRHRKQRKAKELKSKGGGKTQDKGLIHQDITGGTDAPEEKLMKIANYISSKTGINPYFLYAQMVHESGWGKSWYAVNWHNYGGLAIYDSGASEHGHFNTDQEYADAWIHDIVTDGYFGDLNTAKTLDEYVNILQGENRPHYFTGDKQTYYNNMASILRHTAGAKEGLIRANFNGFGNGGGGVKGNAQIVFANGSSVGGNKNEKPKTVSEMISGFNKPKKSAIQGMIINGQAVPLSQIIPKTNIVQITKQRQNHVKNLTDEINKQTIAKEQFEKASDEERLKLINSKIAQLEKQRDELKKALEDEKQKEIEEEQNKHSKTAMLYVFGSLKKDKSYTDMMDKINSAVQQIQNVAGVELTNKIATEDGVFTLSNKGDENNNTDNTNPQATNEQQKWTQEDAMHDMRAGLKLPSKKGNA